MDTASNGDGKTSHSSIQNRKAEKIRNPSQSHSTRVFEIGDVKVNVFNAKVKAGLTDGFDSESKTFTLY